MRKFDNYEPGVVGVALLSSPELTLEMIAMEYTCTL